MKWQREPPNEPGDWLWVIMWDCGCCVLDKDIAWVTHKNWSPEDMDLELPNNLMLSWRTQGKDRLPELEEITGWLKTDLPPKEWVI